MRKRDGRAKLQVKRERLRQLTTLAISEAAQVVAGADPNTMAHNGAGRVWSRCCPP